MDQVRRDEFVRHSPTSTSYHKVDLQEIDTTFYVYIMASGRNGTTDVSITQTSSIAYRDQKNDLHPRDFTSLNQIHDLVYVEEFDDMIEAITRHGDLWRWPPEQLAGLVEQDNPRWLDIYGQYTS